MRLIGELNRSFDNFLTLRGIAKMGDIEQLSEPDPSYQRDQYKEHSKKMLAFLESGQYMFYPELILSATLDKKDNIQDKVNNLYESVPQKTFSNSTFGDFKLRGTTKGTTSQSDSRVSDYHCIGVLEPLDDRKKIFNRIDGNHRLSATKESGKEDMLVPFCIILFRNNKEAQEFSRILFTNINYKHLPLTSEENLRLIIDKREDGEYTYSDDELRKGKVWFGAHFYLARKAFKELNSYNLEIIQEILCSNKIHTYTRTLLVELFELLLYKEKINKEYENKKNYDNLENQKLKEAFYEVEKCYSSYALNTPSKNYQLILTHLYFYYEEKLVLFSNWVKENHIYELQSTKPEELIALFDKVLESKKRTIFLAMDFGKEAKENHDAIKDAIEGINSETDQDLKLTLLRIDKNSEGHSFKITDEILKQIENGGYFIADVSLGNKNVYHELGYQMGLNQGKGLKQDNFLLVHNKGVSGACFKEDVSFNIASISIVKVKNSNDLRKEVKKKINIYYNFDNEREV